VKIEARKYAPGETLPGEQHAVLAGSVTPLENGSVEVARSPQKAIIASVHS
jgi:hypothetical protein